MKKIIKLISILFVVFLLVGCDDNKTFKEEDFKIILSSDYEKGQLEGYTYYYESDDAIITVLEETLEDLEGLELTSESSVRDYMKLIVELNGKNDTIIEKDGVIYIEYTASVEDNEFYYLTSAYKGKDSFWLINFICSVEDKEIMSKKFLNFAKSVEL